jgi:hypothetical protein
VRMYTRTVITDEYNMGNGGELMCTVPQNI